MGQSNGFKSLMNQITFGSSFFGLSFDRSKRRNLKVYILLTAMLIEIVIALIGDLILESDADEQLLLKIGNLSYFFLHHNRDSFLTYFTLSIRLNSFLLLLYHLVLDYRWLEDADRIYGQLTIGVKQNHIDSLRHQIRRYSTFSLALTLLLGYLLIANAYFTKPVGLSFWQLLPSLLVAHFNIIVYPLVQIRFVSQYHLICSVCSNLVGQLDYQIVEALTQDSVRRLGACLFQFSQVFQLLTFINRFLKSIYIIYTGASFLILVPVMWIVGFAKTNPFIAFIWILFVLYYLVVNVYLSYLTGKVDSQANESTNQLYRKFILSPDSTVQEMQTIQYQVLCTAT